MPDPAGISECQRAGLALGAGRKFQIGSPNAWTPDDGAIVVTGTRSGAQGIYAVAAERNEVMRDLRQYHEELIADNSKPACTNRVIATTWVLGFRLLEVVSYIVHSNF